MQNQQYSVGDRVEKFCVTCNEQITHIIKSVTKLGKISKVNCAQCGLLGTFKPAAMALQELSHKTGAPYDRTKTYRIGQIMEHPTFGVGEVTTVFPANTIDVLFLDRTRRLIHSRV